eukprot:5693797-Prymnesium_polylepis.1
MLDDSLEFKSTRTQVWPRTTEAFSKTSEPRTRLERPAHRTRALLAPGLGMAMRSNAFVLPDLLTVDLAGKNGGASAAKLGHMLREADK